MATEKVTAAQIKTEYGSIVIPQELIARVAGFAAVENYGIVGMKTKGKRNSFMRLFQKEDLKRGVKISFLDDDTIGVDLCVTLEYGVSLPAVADNAKDNVKYCVENLLGLKVQYVNVYVEGVRA